MLLYKTPKIIDEYGQFVNPAFLNLFSGLPDKEQEIHCKPEDKTVDPAHPGGNSCDRHLTYGSSK